MLRCVRYVYDYTIQQLRTSSAEGKCKLFDRIEDKLVKSFFDVKVGLTSTNLCHHGSISLEEWDSLCLKNNSYSFFELLIIKVCSLH